MICIKVNIPQELCEIDDELKAIYHSKDTICFFIFKTRDERNEFMEINMEHKITILWNKIKMTKDTFSKIALTKELDELVTKYKNELITKFQREKK